MIILCISLMCLKSIFMLLSKILLLIWSEKGTSDDQIKELIATVFFIKSILEWSSRIFLFGIFLFRMHKAEVLKLCSTRENKWKINKNQGNSQECKIYFNANVYANVVTILNFERLLWIVKFWQCHVYWWYLRINWVMR